ncbi:DUF6470 family protein [Aneurinibacillus tyrosinisolvens]|uniref:DUF6470 family protein n=1 Tax=Aneurinibacillus tyrosinisolvens TaxID=1443435 RepID=UPI00063F747C|nr:DUF6470 family protein [Aneurinibacillus tyrosinisolvens]
MNLPRVELQQSWMKMDWDIQEPSYTFEPAHSQVNIEQKPAEMFINRTPSQLTIDQTQCWADMDLKPISRRIAEAAADGERSVLKYIERVGAEGEQLGAIENRGNVVTSIARSKKLFPDYQFAYRNIPGNFSLRIGFTPSELNMDWQLNGTQIDVQSTPSHHDYERGKISYYIKQKNQLQVNIVGGNVNVGY